MQNIKSFLFIVGPLLMCCNHIWGQGAFVLDNAYVTNRVSIDKPGNPYSGIFGMEVWQSGNTNASLSGVLDMAAMTDSLAAYQLLVANGFRLENSFAGQTMVQGVFWLDYVKMPGGQSSRQHGHARAGGLEQQRAELGFGAGQRRQGRTHFFLAADGGLRFWNSGNTTGSQLDRAAGFSDDDHY